MGDINQTITLEAVGGEASAAEIEKAAFALKSVTTASSQMESQFQHSFQHIGLMLFAGSALRASGLGAETRMIITGLNTALSAGGAAFGAAAAPALLFVTALIAVAGIAEKVIQHHKEEADALQKVIDTQSKAYDTYTSEADILTELGTLGGGLTDHMQALKDADNTVAEDLKNNLLTGLSQEIDALKRQQDALQKSADMHAAWSLHITQIKLALTMLLVPFNSVVTTTEKWFHALTALLPTFVHHTQMVGEMKDQYDVLAQRIDKASVSQDMLAENGTADLTKVRDATKKAYDEEEKAWEDMSKAISDGEKVQTEYLMTLHKQIAEDQKKQQEAITKTNAEELKKQTETAVKATTEISSVFATAFAKNIVEGQNFSVTIQQQFQSMAERFIEYVIEMMIIWIALKAVMEIWGGAGVAAFKASAMTAYPMLGQMGLSTATKGQIGGAFMVSQPTMFLAGEAGPENVNIAPIGSPTSHSGSGGNVTTGDINVTVQLASMGPGDVQAMLRQLADAIRQETVDAIRFATTTVGIGNNYSSRAY